MARRAGGMAIGILLPCFLLSVWPAEAGKPKKAATQGVVVEDIARGSAAERAGLEAGDLIFSWLREAAPPANPSPTKGRIDSPFDLTDVETEQAPRARVTLVGRHGAREGSWTLPPGDWGLQARPAQLSEDLLRLYQEGKELVASEKLEDGLARWREAATEMRKTGQVGAWFLLKVARALAEARKWPDADSAYADAVTVAEGAAPAPGAQALREWGGLLEKRSEWDRATDCYRRASAHDEKLGPESLAVALSLDNQGLVARKRGDLKTGEEFHRRALAMREKLAPGSLAVATSLYNLGAVAGIRREDLALADDQFRRSLSIREKLVPGTSDVSRSLIGLGLLALDRGEPATAEEQLRRALAIQMKIAPESRDVAITHQNLSAVALERGDLAMAEEHLRQALVIKEKLAPESLSLAGSLHGLGDVALSRGDLEAAERYHRRALALREKLAPESLDVTWSLTGLGDVALSRGDLAAAEQHLLRALAIREKVAPDGLEVAASLTGLGEVALSRGDLAAAEQYHRRALAIQEKLVPGTLDVARCLTGLGEVASSRGDVAAAEQSHQQALAIRERLAPGSALQAESLHALGVTYRHGGRAGPAREFLCRAIDVLEQQKTKLGGTEEIKAAFGARYADYYRDCAEALTEQGRSAEALHVVERSRARSLLKMLAERDLLFAADLPADLALERSRTDAEYDRSQAALAQLSAGKDDQEIERLVTRLSELRDKQQQIAQHVRKASPRLAALQYPEPLNLADVQRALDPGTLLLAYSVGKDKTLLFAVQPPGASPGLSVLTLPTTEQALREKVEAFRDLIQRRSRDDQDVLARRARELYDILVRPADSLIGPSERVLICPDGPLHTLPFAALVRVQSTARKGQTTARYFVEWKPLHAVVSATVYAELKKSRREAPASSAVVLEAFGDPKYASLSKEQTEQIGNPELRSILTRGFTATPLPWTRQEVEAIAGLYPGKSAVHLGEEATEEKAKSLGKDVRYVHFACHGLLNERFPLDSALVLTIPEHPAEGQDNGLLQAWEVFEQVRIDADLVTLSACETALGKEMGGEGLVGLTRAFQYAGARSVLASLWAIADQSSADLMRRFYGYVKDGRSKDEALRAAQMDQIRGDAPPFHWAAFQVTGDWK